MSPIEAISALEHGEKFAQVREAYRVAARERWRAMPVLVLILGPAIIALMLFGRFWGAGETVAAMVAGAAFALIVFLGHSALRSFLRLDRAVSRWQPSAHAWSAEERRSQ